MAGTRFISAVVLIACFYLTVADFFPDPDNTDAILVIPHERFRRFVRIMSRKPEPDAEPETGIGWKGHVKNLLSGGTINVKMSLPYFDKWSKYIPFLKKLSEEEKKEFIMLTKEERMANNRPDINPTLGYEEP